MSKRTTAVNAAVNAETARAGATGARIARIVIGVLVATMLAGLALAATQEQQAFIDGFEEGLAHGELEGREGSHFDWSTQRPVDAANEATYDLGRTRLRVGIKVDATQDAYVTGYALGYYQGFFDRQHPDYEDASLFSVRDDPFYDRGDFRPSRHANAEERYGFTPVAGMPYPPREPGLFAQSVVVVPAQDPAWRQSSDGWFWAPQVLTSGYAAAWRPRYQSDCAYTEYAQYGSPWYR